VLRCNQRSPSGKQTSIRTHGDTIEHHSNGGKELWRGAESSSVPRVTVAASFAGIFAAIVVAVALFASAHGGRSAASGPLAQAVDKTRDQGTARLSSLKRGQGLGVAYDHRATGVVDFAHDFSSMTQRSLIGGESAPGSRQVKLGDDLYTKMGGKWLHEHIGNGNTTADVDPAYLLDFVHDSATAVSRVGAGRVNGAKTVVYRANIDLKAAVEHELRDLGWSANAAEQFIGNELDGPATLKVWIDGHGLIRRVALKSANQSETLVLTDFGVHVNARPPEA
jgi:hypothetical protein